jgi:hypothetical protein
MIESQSQQITRRDRINPRFMKELAEELAEPMSMVFRQSVEESVVLEEWNKAKISAIHKKGYKSQAGNYRPVCLTSVMSKVMENIVRAHIIDPMKKTITSLASSTASCRVDRQHYSFSQLWTGGQRHWAQETQ